jgi:hypothetical protein
VLANKLLKPLVNQFFISLFGPFFNVNRVPGSLQAKMDYAPEIRREEKLAGPAENCGSEELIGLFHKFGYVSMIVNPSPRRGF